LHYGGDRGTLFLGIYIEFMSAEKNLATKIEELKAFSDDIIAYGRKLEDGIRDTAIALEVYERFYDHFQLLEEIKTHRTKPDLMQKELIAELNEERKSLQTQNDELIESCLSFQESITMLQQENAELKAALLVKPKSDVELKNSAYYLTNSHRILEDGIRETAIAFGVHQSHYNSFELLEEIKSYRTKQKELVAELEESLATESKRSFQLAHENHEMETLLLNTGKQSFQYSDQLRDRIAELKLEIGRLTEQNAELKAGLVAESRQLQEHMAGQDLQLLRTSVVALAKSTHAAGIPLSGTSTPLDFVNWLTDYYRCIVKPVNELQALDKASLARNWSAIFDEITSLAEVIELPDRHGSTAFSVTNALDLLQRITVYCKADRGNHASLTNTIKNWANSLDLNSGCFTTLGLLNEIKDYYRIEDEDQYDDECGDRVPAENENLQVELARLNQSLRSIESAIASCSSSLGVYHVGLTSIGLLNGIECTYKSTDLTKALSYLNRIATALGLETIRLTSFEDVVTAAKDTVVARQLLLGVMRSCSHASLSCLSPTKLTSR